MSNIILGIDLGTTNSVASYWDGKKYVNIKNGDTNIFPSIIEFTEKGKIICNTNYNNLNCIKNIKRFIGQEDNISNIFLNDLNYDYNISNKKINLYNKFERKSYTLEELNSLILKFIKKKAEKQTNEEIKEVVVTIPAHFSQNQRDSVLISCKLSNLECIRLLNEPTSAALAYGLNNHNDINVLIFDLGGGTFDLSLLNIDDGIYEVIGTNGDNKLGGEDFTNILLNDVLEEINFSVNDVTKKEIKMLCEKFKKNEINEIKFKQFKYSKKRNEITYLFNSLLHKIEKIIDELLNYSKIDYIVMVGGSSRLKEIISLINFKFDNSKIISNIDPDLVVSYGAALQGYILKNSDDVFSKSIALVDVLPLSIGVESDSGLMTKIIKKGSKIPIKNKSVFTNDKDNIEELEIEIYQGERSLVKDNILVGKLKLDKISKKEKGKNVIVIEMRVNNNCMLEVSAYEKTSNNKISISIDNYNKNLDEEKLIKIIKESEKFDEADSLKYKYHKLLNKLNDQIENLRYNYDSNSYIKLESEDKEKISKHLSILESKLGDIKSEYNFDLDNNNLLNLVNSLKKLLKVNESKYSMLIKSYDNNSNDLVLEKSDLEEISFDLSEYNNLIQDYINQKTENMSMISKYTKENIMMYFNNLLCKLNSISLDESEFERYKNDIDNILEKFKLKDVELINSYGNINSIKELFKVNNINYDITKFYNLNSLEIFNLLYDISVQYNLKI
jgi:molecular chaperone DnaK (HSP70)